MVPLAGGFIPDCLIGWLFYFYLLVASDFSYYYIGYFLLQSRID